jgi:hypothetical protein
MKKMTGKWPENQVGGKTKMMKNLQEKAKISRKLKIAGKSK